MREGFICNPNITSADLDEIKKAIRISHVAQWIHSSIDGLNASKTARLCGVFVDDFIVSFAWIMQRNLNIDEKVYKGLSVGVVTTLPNKRNQGYARVLIDGIENEAIQNGFDFLYLAGISNFYGKYGFRGFAPKSKLVFNRSDLPEGNGTVAPLSKEHIPVIAKIYSDYSNEISSSFLRSEHDWEDLVDTLSSTFLFSRPKVVLDGSGRLAGYFCNTPGYERIIREFVPVLDCHSVANTLAVIANYNEVPKAETLEIFTPAKGPIWQAAASKIGADYLCFLRPRASNMIKWISASKTFDEFHCEFILQGDLL